MFLVGVDLVVVAVAAPSFVLWWSLAVPVAPTLGYVYLCRRQVRRENDALWSQPDQAAAGADIAPRRAIRVDAPYGTLRSPRNEQGFEEVTPDEETVVIPASAVRAAAGASSAASVACAESTAFAESDTSASEDEVAAHAVAVETVAVAVPTLDGGSLWDPLPVTLPTYVGKPRAARTVRTIDLSEPGTWSSGRSEADSRLVDEADVASEGAGAGQDDQRAVGS